jgi:hypothetical protein
MFKAYATYISFLTGEVTARSPGRPLPRKPPRMGKCQGGVKNTVEGSENAWGYTWNMRVIGIYQDMDKDIYIYTNKHDILRVCNRKGLFQPWPFE